MKKLSLLFGLVLAFGVCHAQEKLPTVVPDRPGFTFGAAVVQHNKITWDNGFVFESTPDGSHNITLNSTILRYGLFENMELRVGTDFVLLNNGLESPSLGVGPLAAGVKFKLNDGHGFIPTVGFLAEVKLPHVGTKEMLPSHLAPAMYAIFEHAIGERLWLCYNAGLEWDGEAAAPKTFLALGFGGSITETLGAYVETYNYLHREDENQYMTEFGLTWLASRRVQLDVECDLDFLHFGKYYALGFGVSWLIN